jgi:antitoxin (DNA-binding transcriptional repressor) of toxin-antitoxin stability system
MKAKDFVGLTWLKMATARHLRALDEPVLVCCHSQPVAAIVPYELYLQWQEKLKKAEGLQN